MSKDKAICLNCGYKGNKFNAYIMSASIKYPNRLLRYDTRETPVKDTYIGDGSGEAEATIRVGCPKCGCCSIQLSCKVDCLVKCEIV